MSIAFESLRVVRMSTHEGLKWWIIGDSSYGYTRRADFEGLTTSYETRAAALAALRAYRARVAEREAGQAAAAAAHAALVAERSRW